MNEITYTATGIKIDNVEISLEEITRKVNYAKISSENLVLMTIEWYGGRGFDGAKEEIVLKRDNAHKLKTLITGLTVQFGEIAGKHSDVYGELEADEIFINENDAAVNTFISQCPGEHSYNHSFIDAISDYCGEEGYDFTSEELWELIK